MTLGELRAKLKNVPDHTPVYGWNYEFDCVDDISMQMLGWRFVTAVTQVLIFSLKSEDPKFVKGAISTREDIL